MPVSYPVRREKVFGLGSFEGLEASKTVRRRRRTVCADQKQPFRWLRVNPCIQLPEGEVPPPIKSSPDAVRFFRGAVEYAGRGVEYSMVMSLDPQNRPLAIAVTSQGGRASTVIDPGVVFQPVLLSNGTACIFAHNHPSGNTAPSDEDIAFTSRLVKGANYLGLNLLDSIILTDTEKDYFSLLDAGLMPSD